VVDHCFRSDGALVGQVEAEVYGGFTDFGFHIAALSDYEAR
jgi:hypothetical protein